MGPYVDVLAAGRAQRVFFPVYRFRVAFKNSNAFRPLSWASEKVHDYPRILGVVDIVCHRCVLCLSGNEGDALLRSVE